MPAVKTVKKRTKTASKPASSKKSASSTILKDMGLQMPMEKTSEPAGIGNAPGISKSWITLGALVVLVVLVGLEVTVMLKGKTDRHRSLQYVDKIGERVGGPPNAPGRFWGQLVVRTDAQGRVFVVDHAFNKVVAWNTKDGAHLKDLDGAAVQKENFAPKNVGVAQDGRVYLLDKTNSEIDVFSPELAFVKRFPVSAAEDMAMAPNGDVLVIDTAQDAVVRYSPEGAELQRFEKGKLTDPRHMATDKLGNVYVEDVGKRQIQVFSPAGKAKYAFPIKFKMPVDFTTMTLRDDKVWISQLSTNQIWIYSLQGKLKWEIQQPLPEPFDLDADGVLYMTGGPGVCKYKVGEK